MSLYGEGAYQAPDGRSVYPPLRTEAALAARRFELYEAAEPPIPGAAEPPIPGHEGQELVPLGTSLDNPPEPTAIYAITKRDHEEMFLAVGAAYDLPVVALRYFNVYGPRQALSNPYTGVVAIFSSRLLNRRPPLVYEDGRQTRDFVHVSDIVQANLLALASEAAGGRIYNVGTGRAISVLQVAETLSELLDFGEKPEVLGEYRAGDIRIVGRHLAHPRELGYRPRVAFARAARAAGLAAHAGADDAADRREPRAGRARADALMAARGRLELSRLEKLVHGFERVRLLVVGDVMLDEYLWGDVERVSPEAPVPVVHVRRESRALGGAGNVVRNVVAMGAQCRFCAVVGDDAAGDRIVDLLKELGVPPDGVVRDPARPTTRKTRVEARSQQLLRYDRETDEAIAGGAAKRLVAAIEAALDGVDASSSRTMPRACSPPPSCVRCCGVAARAACSWRWIPRTRWRRTAGPRW